MIRPFAYTLGEVTDPGKLSSDFAAGVGAVANSSSSEKARLATSLVVGVATTKGLGEVGAMARAGEIADEAATTARDGRGRRGLGDGGRHGRVGERLPAGRR